MEENSNDKKDVIEITKYEYLDLVIDSHIVTQISSVFENKDLYDFEKLTSIKSILQMN